MNEDKLEKLRISAYKTDASRIESTPAQVVLPENIEEIRDVVLFSRNLAIRGGGSGLQGVNAENSTILSLEKLNKILSLDKSKKEVYVEAGLVLDKLNKFLKEYGLEFPVQPLSSSICTIGGMIATNASGFRELKYGRAGNLAQQVELINGKGELLKINKADLIDVMGEEGITGIIVRARLKLIKKPVRTVSLFRLASLEEVIALVKKLRLVENISMIFFLDKLTSSFLGLEDKYHIIAEFESEQGREKEKDYEKLISLVKKAYPSLAKLGYSILEDPKIFIDKLQDFAGFLEENKVPYFADLGVGIIHPCFQPNQKDLIPLMLENIRKLHGKVTGKFGIGIRKKQYLDNLEKKIIIRLKSRYDPGFKINPGVIIDKPEEVKMKKPEAKQEAEEETEEEMQEELEEEIEKRAEDNIDETEEALDEDLQHKEKIKSKDKENEMQDELAEAVE